MKNNPIFQFGIKMEEYPVPVLNEREVRAGAGVLFLFAFISFMNARLIGNMEPLKIFIIIFFVDFFIRVFLNPQFAPSLIIGRLCVSRQKPEYVGAPQKRFAWAIGLILSSFMLVWVVVLGQVGMVNLAVCVLCLSLLFLETSCGICVGCSIYNMFSKQKAQLCPGGVCEIGVRQNKRASFPLSFFEIIVVLGCIVMVCILAMSDVLVY